MIEEGIKERGGGYSIDQLKSVLQYIEKVERSEEEVKHIPFGEGHYPWPGTLNKLLDMCKNYSKVILYGISKTCCVKWAWDDLKKAGIEAVIDERGVI